MRRGTSGALSFAPQVRDRRQVGGSAQSRDNLRTGLGALLPDVLELGLDNSAALRGGKKRVLHGFEGTKSVLL